MCIIHKGFRGFQTVSSALNLDGNLIGLKPAIPYEIIHLPLYTIIKDRNNNPTLNRNQNLKDLRT